MRAMLALTLREFDIEPAYPDDAPEVSGEKAYPAMVQGDITNHVKDRFPVKIKLRRQAN